MVKLFGRKTEQANTSVTDDLGRKAVINVRDITRTYEMGEQTLQVLKGITLQIYEGEIVSIMGPSGSGKSTLMNILGALDRPSSGEYYLDGVDVSKMTETELADVRNRKIGFVFQSFNLLKRTAAIRQVELPLIYAGSPNRTKRAKASLEAVGLGDRLDHLPSELSGGQQQRVAIARAIVTEPAMILADEPTGNLDSKSGTEVMQIFQRLNRERGITTVFVTHDPWIARHTGRVIMIRDGRVVADHLIAAPLTAGEQERPSDDAELSGLLEEGYGASRAGQAVIAVEPPRPKPAGAPDPAAEAGPAESSAATVIAPIPFDDEAKPVAPTAATVEASRVTVEAAAATVETPAAIVEPAPVEPLPIIPFDNDVAPVEIIKDEPAAVEPAAEAPLIPFDDLPVIQSAAQPEEALQPEAPAIPFDEVTTPVASIPARVESAAPTVEAAPLTPFDDVMNPIEAAPVTPSPADEPPPEAPAIPFDEVTQSVEPTPVRVESAALPSDAAPVETLPTPFDEATNPVQAVPTENSTPVEPPVETLPAPSEPVMPVETLPTPFDEATNSVQAVPTESSTPVETLPAPYDTMMPVEPALADIESAVQNADEPAAAAVQPDETQLTPVDQVAAEVEAAPLPVQDQPAVAEAAPPPIDEAQSPAEPVVSPGAQTVETAAVALPEETPESTPEPDSNTPISRADSELFEPDFLTDERGHSNGAGHSLSGNNREPDFLTSEPTLIRSAPALEHPLDGNNREPDFLTSEPTTIRRTPAAPTTENAEPDFLAGVDLPAEPAATAPSAEPETILPFDEKSTPDTAAETEDEPTPIEPSPLAEWLYEPPALNGRSSGPNDGR